MLTEYASGYGGRPAMADETATGHPPQFRRIGHSVLCPWCWRAMGEKISLWSTCALWLCPRCGHTWPRYGGDNG